MNINQQLKHYRHQFEFSQEKLAEKLFVSRQTISNWETGRSYPDLRSLLMLSELFDVSLDELVKGDLTMMKNEVEKQKMNKYSMGMALGWVLLMVSGPLVLAIGAYGIILLGLSVSFMFYCAYKLERLKKDHNIQTYAEITAFMEDRANDMTKEGRELEKKKAKRQKIMLMIGSGVITLVVMLLLMVIAQLFI